jgi:hypothetical protein
MVNGLRTVRFVKVAFVPRKLVDDARFENTLVEDTVPATTPPKVEVEVVAVRPPVRFRLVPVALMNSTLLRFERPEFVMYEVEIPANVEVPEVAVIPFAFRLPVTAKFVAVPFVTLVLPRVVVPTAERLPEKLPLVAEALPRAV